MTAVRRAGHASGQALRVLLVYYEPQPSGQTRHVLSLARGLDRQRYRVTVVLPDSLKDSAARYEQAGAEVVPLPLRKLAWPPRAITAMVRLVRQGAFDLVHVHSQEAGMVARPTVRLAGALPIVYTPQTIDIRRSQWHWLYRLAERVLAGFTDVIVSVNEADRGRLVDWGIPTHKVVTIPNGIDLRDFEEPLDSRLLRAALGLDEESPVVMQVGRLSAQKDPFTFLEGAALVVRHRPDVQFALIGDGPLRHPIASRIQALGLDQHVHLLGWRQEAARLVAAADVATLTSRWEGTPYALLEAMAWSRPVVATSVNGCPEVVVDGVTGYLTNPGDALAWAACVLKLLSDPERATGMGKRGRQRVEGRFSIERTLTGVEALYQSMLPS